MQLIKGATGVKQAMVEALWRRVVDDATGVSDPPFARYEESARGDEGYDPASRFWLGLLGPEASVDLPLRSSSLAQRITPSAQGFSFRVDRDRFPIELDLTASFALWITLHPTLEEQRRGARLSDADDTNNGTSSGNGRGEGQGVAMVRMKVPVEDVRVTATVDGPGERTVGRAEFRNAIGRAFDSLPADAVPHRPLRRGKMLPRRYDVADGAAWRRWERGNLMDPALPEWNVELDVEVSDSGDGTSELLVTIVNRSNPAEEQHVDQDGTQKFARGKCDTNIYEARLSCEPSVPVVPYELEQIPDSYRYDRQVAAFGMNAAAEEHGGLLNTAFAAVARTDRVHPRTDGADGAGIDTTFATLKSEPLDALDNLLAQAREWTKVNWGKDALAAMGRKEGWAEDTRDKAEGDARDARREVEWVSEGLRCLREDDDLLEAFKLMNEAMEFASRNKSYDKWYPFQIAYILGCLREVKDPSADSTVDILWFATGGGKTEAYLGLNALILYYGRLKGRTAGTQTWARFPLRLLSLQQTQRVAESVICAEVVRRRHAHLANGEPFSVGYYVGKGNTPNDIVKKGSNWKEGFDPFEAKNAESCRVLEECPACDASEKPVVGFNPDTHTMEHRCANPNCAFSGERLPVFVVDTEIYRWAPSVLVGTVDKLAMLGQNFRLRILMGSASGRCPKHGYSAVPGYCAIFGCAVRDQRPVPSGFGGISFEIQDEMHLLNESLGALDGNYETLFQDIARRHGTDEVRIIGATATIEGYKDQSDHLYRREARRFPIPGPTKAESFWAYERRDDDPDPDPLRTFVAMLPRGKTMLDAGFGMTKSHWNFVEEGLADPRAFCARTPGLVPARAGEVEGYLRDLYEVLVSYNIRKDNLEQYGKDIAEDPEICPDERNYDTITSDVKDIRGVLARLEDPSDDPNQRIRVLTATSAISHGVDIDRLNVMTVMGMPQQTSEFIQATARVGRKHPAVVFCLVNPMRERDVSHFRYFSKYAEYLDRLVERVPVNRESLPVLKRVLPGGLMALILLVYEPEWLRPGGKQPKRKRERLYHVRSMARAMDEGFITEDKLVEDLLRAFSVDAADPRFADHVLAVREFVRTNLSNFDRRRGSGNSTSDEMEPPPPTSLRDVETPIEIRGEW